jgi:hypothetical protein
MLPRLPSSRTHVGLVIKPTVISASNNEAIIMVGAEKQSRASQLDSQLSTSTEYLDMEPG